MSRAFAPAEDSTITPSDKAEQADFKTLLRSLHAMKNIKSDTQCWDRTSPAPTGKSEP